MPPDVLKKKPPKLASTLEDRGYLLSDEIFSAVENMKGKTEDGFTLAIEHYKRQSGKYRRGHIEFIDTATKKLKDYNLHQDIKMYKRVFSLFPEKEYIPPTRMMEEFYHMPRHQDAAIQILQEMEDNGLIPDSEIRDMIKDRFSENSEVMYKFQRMVYWMSKFANANPWPVPYHPPDDRIELAKAALRRMSFDINTKIDVWTAENVEDLKAEDEGEEDDFIVSAQSPEQQDLIATHPTDKPVYVEGRHYVYLGSARMTYHVLRTDPPQEGSEFYGIAPDEKEEEFWSDDFDSWNFFAAEEQTAIVPEKSIHEQEDGTILSMCITGSPSQNTLVTWLRCLQDTNPNLENVAVVFKLQEPDAILNYAENHVKEGGPS
ncbi:hypothetical protein FSP39_000916 [Pinctada imbricata]|uniref:Evolutionarily conserved signaling intermediate in Toll pathway, mitochondrial n=1 Tax=Pinctada imbricata TaxID=66713 RepID=A0AA89C029_PINIB|nr:hypothetical protein FSP39_000916 [Pinctada imbricata]